MVRTALLLSIDLRSVLKIIIFFFLFLNNAYSDHRDFEKILEEDSTKCEKIGYAYGGDDFRDCVMYMFNKREERRMYECARAEQMNRELGSSGGFWGGVLQGLNSQIHCEP